MNTVTFLKTFEYRRPPLTGGKWKSTASTVYRAGATVEVSDDVLAAAIAKGAVEASAAVLEAKGRKRVVVGLDLASGGDAASAVVVSEVPGGADVD